MYIVLSKMFRISINLRRLFFMFFTTKDNREQLSLREGVENFKKLLETREVVEDLMAHVTVEKLSVITKVNEKYIKYEFALFVYNLVLYTNLQTILEHYTKNVKNQQYVIEKTSTEAIDLDFECIFSVKYTNIIYVIIRNITEIPRLIKQFI